MKAAFEQLLHRLNALAHHLLRVTGAAQSLVTLGKQGLVLFDQYQPTDIDGAWERKLRSAYLPALSSSVIDPLGCGDVPLAGIADVMKEIGCAELPMLEVISHTADADIADGPVVVAQLRELIAGADAQEPFGDLFAGFLRRGT